MRLAVKKLDIPFTDRIYSLYILYKTAASYSAVCGIYSDGKTFVQETVSSRVKGMRTAQVQKTRQIVRKKGWKTM